MAGEIVNICPRCCCCVAVFILFVFPFIAICQDKNLLPYPIGLYPLNKLYNTADASCYGNLGGIAQNVKLVTGPFGKAYTAYEFAGVGTSHITIPQSPHLDAEKSITILVWIFQTGQPGSVIQYLNNNYGGVGLHTLNANSVFMQFLERNGNTVSFSNHTVSLHNHWQYIGVSYNYDSGTATLWIDGKDVQQMNLGKFKLSTNRDIRIGSGQGNGDSFEGRISCLQIYDTALTRDEVTAVRNRCFQDNQAPVDCRTSSAPSGCGVPMNTQSGTFYSPGYPSGYPYDANCVWEIEVLDGYYIKLQFSQFDLEEAYLNKWPDCPDYVIIYDGITSWSTKLTALCGGQEGWEKEITSSGNGMRVEFVSNGVGSARGFIAKYTASPIDEVEKEQDEEMMDFSSHYTGIVIGVACAAIFAILSIITFSHTRRRLQERRHGSLTNSSRRRVSFSDNDIFQQNAPPTYDDVMRYPELYPPTPCQGSLANTPAATPRQGSPVSTPRMARCALDRHGSPMLIPKVGTPIGMPLFNPLRGSSGHSTPQRTPRVSIQRGISPLARAELTPQHSRQADHASADGHDDDDDDDEELPPYPGIMGDNARGNYMPLNMNTDSVLDQVRETLEHRSFVPRQQSNPSLSDDSSSDSNHDGAVNVPIGSLSSSRNMDNTGLSPAGVEANRNSISSMPSVGDSGHVNPWVSHKFPREGRYGGTLRSIESDV